MPAPSNHTENRGNEHRQQQPRRRRRERFFNRRSHRWEWRWM